MIGLMLALLQTPMQVVELPDPSVQEITIQALVKLPKLGAKDLAKLQILGRTIPKQTQEYPRREMLVVTNGYPVECDVTVDRLRIMVNVLPGNLKAGLSLMESLLLHATLTQENLDAAELGDSPADTWSAAVDGRILPAVKLNQDEAQLLYRRVIRPERLLLAVGGKIVPGDAQAAWEQRTSHWSFDRIPKAYYDETPVAPRTTSSGSVAIVDLRDPEVLAGDVAMPTRLLALFGLGTGKGASLFRTVRTKHGWSYRQESILSPTLIGWQPQLMIASVPSEDMAQRVDTIKSDLLDDIKSWTEADRARALGMAEAVIDRGLRFSPIYALGTSPVGDSLEDRTYLAGYWKLKTGQVWNGPAMLASMKDVTLDMLKDQATQIVLSSTATILPGNSR